MMVPVREHLAAQFSDPKISRSKLTFARGQEHLGFDEC